MILSHEAYELMFVHAKSLIKCLKKEQNIHFTNEISFQFIKS